MIRIGRSRLFGLVLGSLSVAALIVVVAASNWSLGQDELGDAAPKNNLTQGNINVLPVLVVRLGEISAPARSDDYRGVLQPSKKAELAFRRSGKILSIAVDEGSKVQKGELLARLETSDIEAVIEATDARIREAQAMLDELEAGPREQTVAASEAEVRRLEAALELAKITAGREQELQKTRASSIQAYDDARYDVLQQAAALDAAKQKLDELRAGTRQEQIAAQAARVAALKADKRRYMVDLEDSQIVAPFSGVVSRRYLDEGSIAGPEGPVLRLLQIDPLEAKFGLTPEDAGSLALGQEMTVTMGQTHIEGVVSNIEPEVDLATRTQAVLLSIPMQRGQGVNNQTINRNIVVGRTVSLSLGNVETNGGQFGNSTGVDGQSFWVPVTALNKSTRGLWSLLIASPVSDDVHQVIRRDVQVQETDTRLAKITGNMIKSGDLIIADGTHRVSPGVLVQPIFEGDAE